MNIEKWMQDNQIISTLPKEMKDKLNRKGVREKVILKYSQLDKYKQIRHRLTQLVRKDTFYSSADIHDLVNRVLKSDYDIKKTSSIFKLLFRTNDAFIRDKDGYNIRGFKVY